MAASMLPCVPEAFWTMKRSDGEAGAACCDFKSKDIGARLIAGAELIVNRVEVEKAKTTSKPVTVAAAVTLDLRIRSGKNLLVSPAMDRPIAARNMLMLLIAAF
jgi:hypothetical protein